MITVAKRELKARMSTYFRRVEQTGEPLVVTDHGRSVLKIVPLRATASVEVAFGGLRGKLVTPTEKSLLAPMTAEWAED